MIEDTIFVLCEACGSEGRIIVSAGYDRETGAPLERDQGPCEYCEGTGIETIEGEPIDEDDIEFLTQGRINH